MFNPNVSHQEVAGIMKDFLEFCINEEHDDIEDGVNAFLVRENDRRSFEYLFRNYGYDQLEEWLMESENARDKRLSK